MRVLRRGVAALLLASAGMPSLAVAAELSHHAAHGPHHHDPGPAPATLAVIGHGHAHASDEEEHSHPAFAPAPVAFRLAAGPGAALASVMQHPGTVVAGPHGARLVDRAARGAPPPGPPPPSIRILRI